MSQLKTVYYKNYPFNIIYSQHTYHGIWPRRISKSDIFDDYSVRWFIRYDSFININIDGKYLVMYISNCNSSDMLTELYHTISIISKIGPAASLALPMISKSLPPFTNLWMENNEHIPACTVYIQLHLIVLLKSRTQLYNVATYVCYKSTTTLINDK